MKRMNVQKKIAVCGMLFILTQSFMGCGKPTQSSMDTTMPTALSMEDTPIINYVLPTVTPHVFANCIGYDAEGEKVAILAGKQPFQHFQIVDTQTKESVFTGDVTEMEFDVKLGMYLGEAHFSGLCIPGEYYLEAEYIGRSKNFVIDEQFYLNQFYDLYGKLTSACLDRTISVEDAISLLMVYEGYPSLFLDDNKDKVPDVLEVCKNWISYRIEEKISTKEDLLFVAFLAKFSNLYRNIDKGYATDCVRQASALYEKTYKSTLLDAQNFFALTELYRATGSYTYRQSIRDYKQELENTNKFFEDYGYIYGAMTYIQTRQKVDVELCETLVNAVLDQSEILAENHKDMIHPIKTMDVEDKDILKRAVILGSSNYMLNNYKYNRMMEELADYLMGANRSAACIDTEEGLPSGYFLLIGQLAAVHANEK